MPWREAAKMHPCMLHNRATVSNSYGVYVHSQHRQYRYIPSAHQGVGRPEECIDQQGVLITSKSGFKDVLCKPKVLPLKSPTMEKLEEL